MTHLKTLLNNVILEDDVLLHVELIRFVLLSKKLMLWTKSGCVGNRFVWLGCECSSKELISKTTLSLIPNYSKIILWKREHFMLINTCKYWVEFFYSSSGGTISSPVTSSSTAVKSSTSIAITPSPATAAKSPPTSTSSSKQLTVEAEKSKVRFKITKATCIFCTLKLQLNFANDCLSLNRNKTYLGKWHQMSQQRTIQRCTYLWLKQRTRV